jgi:hypothetical protein
LLTILSSFTERLPAAQLPCYAAPSSPQVLKIAASIHKIGPSQPGQGGR